jgi:hypothetical protein
LFANEGLELMTRKMVKAANTRTKKRDAERKKALEEIERLALHALDSGPATPLTHEDFEEIRQKLREKYGDRNGRAK